MSTKTKFFHCLLILLTALFQINLANAASVRQLSVDDLLQSAELVFEGNVIASESRFNETRTSINTYVTFEIIDVVNGNYPDETIELSFAGGAAQDLEMEISGMIYPQVGDSGIYFIEQIGKVFINPIVGWDQGHFLILKDEEGDERMHTLSRAPIMDMNNQAAPSQALSNGVAIGLRIGGRVGFRGDRQGANNAMLKSAFKQNLKDRFSKLIAE